MNKRVNTLLFVLGATIFNILVTLLLILMLSFIYINFIMPFLPGDVQAWPFVLIFIGAVVLSFVIYRVILNILLKKVNIERYFDPIFKGGHRRP
jgi:hypothetical protein